MPALPRHSPEERLRRIMLRHQRKMSFFETFDMPAFKHEQFKLETRVNRLESYRRVMRDKIDLLRQEAALARDIQDMADDIEMLEQETKELWEEDVVDAWWLPDLENGKSATGDENAREACQLMDEAQRSGQGQGDVRGRERPVQGREAPPVRVIATQRPQGMRRRTRNSRQRVVEHGGTEAPNRAEPVSASHEQDEHSVYVKLEGITENDVRMGDANGGVARRTRSGQHMAGGAQPRPFYVPAAVEDE